MFDASDGTDGFVSVEVAPELGRDTQATTGQRWQHLVRLGAHPQRPLWASTSTKNPTYPDTRYVDELIGPNTVNTLPEPTIAAFEDHGTLARTIDTGVQDADEVMRRLASSGIDMDDVGLTLEDKGVASFDMSFHDMLAGLAGLAGLAAQGHQPTRR